MYSRTAIQKSRLLQHLLCRNTRPVGRILSSYRPDHRQRGKSNGHSHHTTSGIHNHLNQITQDTPKTHSPNINVEANEKHRQIHAWLSPLEPNGRHRDVSHSRPDGFGSWVLRRNEFKTWREGRNGFANHTLLCCGDKGVDKTYISSLVIDTLGEQARRDGVVILFFYCDPRARKEQSAVNIIGCLLRQFVLGGAGIPEGIHSASEEFRQTYGKGLQLPDMVKLFVKTIIPVERAYICIDAADELLPEDRSKLLGALGQIARDAPNTRLFLTGRTNIRGEIEKHFMNGAYNINIETDQGDVARQISRKMDTNARDADMLTENPIKDVMGGTSEKSSEMSPPIALKIDDITGRTSEKALRTWGWPYSRFVSLVNTLRGSPAIVLKSDDILGAESKKTFESSLPIAERFDDILGAESKKTFESSLPIAERFDDISPESRLARQKEMLQKVTMADTDLDSLYGQTLQQIKKQKGDLARLGMEVLMWVSHAKRPLSIDELCHALAVGPAATDLDPKNIRSRDTVLGSCLGLVMAEKKTLKVRLIHDTLQQYLSRPGILSGAHKVLGETCLAYLSSGRVKKLHANKVGDLGNMPFLEYSSRYWGAHAKIELSDRALTLAVKLLNQFENHILFALFLQKTLSDHYSLVSSPPCTGLHYASYMGIDAVVAALIKLKSCDINREGPMGYTPLMWAVVRRNHGTVRLLLTCDGVDPDKPFIEDRTPLWWASSYADEEMVRILVQGGADPTKPSHEGETPLAVASRNKDLRKVALLRPRPITISDLD